MTPISSTNDPVFIDPLTDVGFRHSFASDGSQPLLKEFISLFIGDEVGPAGNEILEQLFDRCRFDNLTDMEKDEYRKNILDYADVQDALEKVKDDSFQNGLVQGIAEGKTEGLAEGEARGRAEGEARAKLAMAKSMIQKGIDLATILAITGLTAQEIS